MNTKPQISLGLAVHQGREGSLESMIRIYQDQLYSYSLRMLRNPFDAQEVTQDAFIGAYRALTQKYDEARCRHLELRPWLFRIVRNLALNRLRARRTVREEPFDAASSESVPGCHTPAEGSPQTSIDLDRMESALAQLNPSARDMIVLRFIEGLSYAEIAAVHRTTEASARGKVFRALQSLRRLLREPAAQQRWSS